MLKTNEETLSNIEAYTMEGHVHTGNYNFVLLEDGTACELDLYGYIKKAGIHNISYNQEEIVKKIVDSFDQNNLEKGNLIELNGHFLIKFHYKSYDQDRKIVDNAISIKVPKESLHSDITKANFYRLSTVCNELGRIKIQNEKRLAEIKHKNKLQKIKTVVTAAAIAASALAGALGLSYGVKKGREHDEAERQMRIEEINQRRAAQDKPPIQYLDKNGNPYNSWEEYYADYRKEYGIDDKTKEQRDLENLYSGLDSVKKKQSEESSEEIESFHL